MYCTHLAKLTYIFTVKDTTLHFLVRHVARNKALNINPGQTRWIQFETKRVIRTLYILFFLCILDLLLFFFWSLFAQNSNDFNLWHHLASGYVTMTYLIQHRLLQLFTGIDQVRSEVAAWFFTGKRWNLKSWKHWLVHCFYIKIRF